MYKTNDPHSANLPARPAPTTVQVTPPLYTDTSERVDDILEQWLRPVVTVIADTGALYAAFDRDDAHHARVTAYLSGLDRKLAIPALVLAELDHLAATFTHDTFRSAAAIAARYQRLGIGLVDASIVALAHEYGTLDILTVDQKHFRAVRPVLARSSMAFHLLPFDA